MGLTIFESIAGIIEAFLKLQVLKEQDKYADMLIKLQGDYRAEFNKPIWDGKDTTTEATKFRNDAQLSELFASLCSLAAAVATAPRK